MSEPFLGEIRLFANGYAPQGWAQCNGQLLQIQQNQALYSLIGRSYGGDGVNTFALPNLQGRVPVHSGGPVGAVGGQEAHTLTVAEMPNHQHTVMGTSTPANNRQANDLVWASNETNKPYGTTINTQMSASSIGNVGQGQAHSNMQPYGVLNFCIALQGVYPSRN
ncbi:phage tail protein [Bacillus horti]|uniref:Microcystin-dependent protein n=1 Tax=Caldalkalibacillus horti TaxID=77523 RepID=A0ABT9VVM2_9BACI|nr:tail fiber protein [Bacillus horti]MDQ0165036.1 microcystin-dependent protein [Bacillus horti]